MSLPLRRRIDNSLLRWQARLDSEWSDRILPWTLSGVLFVVFVTLSLARARTFEGGEDLGVYTQAAWLIVHSADPIVTLNDGTHVLSQQASFLFYPVAWLTRWTPTIPTLLVVQSAALALGVVPLWHIGRRLANLRVVAVGVLVWAYAFYPAVHRLNLGDFHPEVLAVPALLAAALYGLSGRWWLYAAFCALAVAARADLALAVAGMGILLMREGHRRAAVLTAVAGLTYTVLAVSVIQPGYGAGGYAHVESFAAFGDTPLEVGWGMLSHPWQVIEELTIEDNFSVIVFLLAPLFFLPVLAPRFLVPVLPLELLYLVAEVESEAAFTQQTVAITSFAFLATGFALARIGRQGVERVFVDGRVLGALILVSTVFFVRDAPASPYRAPWAWGGRDAADQARLDAVDLVDDQDAVRASPALLPLLAERAEVYLLDTENRPHVRRATERPDDQEREERAGWMRSSTTTRPHLAGPTTSVGSSGRVSNGRATNGYTPRTASRCTCARISRRDLRAAQGLVEGRGSLVERQGVGVGVGAGEIEVVDPPDRHDVQVDMGDLQPCDHEPHPQGSEHRLLGSADLVGHPRQVGHQVGVEVEPVVDLDHGDDQGVARLEWVDGQEGRAALVAPHKTAGQLAPDDLGEDGRHPRIVGWAP